MKKRIHQIELFLKYPHEVQQDVFTNLIATAKNTEFGIEHGFRDIKTIEDYNQRVPVRSYEQHFPYIERTMRGEKNILWPNKSDLS